MNKSKSELKSNRKRSFLEYFYITLGISIPLFGFIIYVYNVNIQNKFINHGKLTVGKVISITSSSLEAGVATFVYRVDNVDYEGTVNLDSYCKTESLKEGKKYLVVYLKEDVKNKRQIIPKECYEHSFGEDVSDIFNKNDLVIKFMCADLSWW